MTDAGRDTTTGSTDETPTEPSSGRPPDRREDTDVAAYPWTPSVLAAIRTRPQWRISAVLIATAIGFSFAWLHWLGLFVAGGLIGLATRTLKRAVLAGALFGSLLLVSQIFLIPTMNVSEFLAFRPPVYVTLGVGIGAPIWGSLIRGVI